MFSKANQVFKIGATAALALGLTACGGSVSSILNDAKLELAQQGGQNIAVLTTEINTQNLVLSAITLPILKDGMELGKVEVLNDVTTNKGYMKVTFNYQAALGLPSPTYSSMLPNGTTIPLAGLDLSKMMIFDVGAGNSKLYLYYDMAAKKSVVGVALNVDSLSIGQPANVFASFNFSSVTGLAGTYLGAQQGTSGLGVFADLSKALFPAAAAAVQQKVSDSGVMFVPASLTADQQRRFDWNLYQLSILGKALVIK